MHQTYRAPARRSRKIRKLNEYVYDFESGESDNENVKSPAKRPKKRKKKNDSRETEESEDNEEGPPKKKKSAKVDVSILAKCLLTSSHEISPFRKSWNSFVSSSMRNLLKWIWLKSQLNVNSRVDFCCLL